MMDTATPQPWKAALPHLVEEALSSPVVPAASRPSHS